MEEIKRQAPLFLYCSYSMKGHCRTLELRVLWLLSSCNMPAPGKKEISRFKKWARDVPGHFCKDAQPAHEEMFRGNGNLKHEVPLHSH